jgi:hypothetical protein
MFQEIQFLNTGIIPPVLVFPFRFRKKQIKRISINQLGLLAKERLFTENFKFILESFLF